MNTRPASVLAAIVLATCASLPASGAFAQSATTPQPAGQAAQGMAGMMPDMAGAPPTNMATMMKQCAQMKARMKTGTTMTADMKPMMDRCDKMDRGMVASKAPDDTLSR